METGMLETRAIQVPVLLPQSRGNQQCRRCQQKILLVLALLQNDWATLIDASLLHPSASAPSVVLCQFLTLCSCLCGERGNPLMMW